MKTNKNIEKLFNIGFVIVFIILVIGIIIEQKDIYNAQQISQDIIITSQQEKQLLTEKYNDNINKYNELINSYNYLYDEYNTTFHFLETTNHKLYEYKHNISMLNNELFLLNKSYNKISNIVNRFYDMSTFKQTALDIALSNEYVMNEYDCTEFSRDLNKALIKQGWKSEVIMVKVDCDSGLFDKDTCEPFDGRHEIVKVKNVYIESTSGSIIDPINYKKYGITK